MAKTASLNIILDPEIKKTAEAIYTHYGLSLAEAVTVFIHQSCNIGGLPFDLRPTQPNNESETMLLSEESLAKDWDTPDEDDLWANL